jgi:hypothetical protein
MEYLKQDGVLAPFFVVLSTGGLLGVDGGESLKMRLQKFEAPTPMFSYGVVLKSVIYGRTGRIANLAKLH